MTDEYIIRTESYSLSLTHMPDGTLTGLEPIVLQTCRSHGAYEEFFTLIAQAEIFYGSITRAMMRPFFSKSVSYILIVLSRVFLVTMISFGLGSPSLTKSCR